MWAGLNSTVMVSLLIAFALVLLCAGVQGTEVEQSLFENFVSNFSKGYKDDVDARAVKFGVFQVYSF